MTPSDAPSTSTDTATVSELLERRNQVQGWLARLDELTPDTAAHVAVRVRADYEDRLAAVLADLAAHLDGIRADVERRRAELDAAGARVAAAADALEEARLRYRIGEVTEEDWEERRPALEAEVDAAAAARDEVAAELSRMEELVAQIDASSEPARIHIPDLAIAAAPAAEEIPADDGVAAGEDEEIWELEDDATLEQPPLRDAPPFLGVVDFPWELPAAAEPAAEAEAETEAPSADFLQDLDRALNEEADDEDSLTLTEAELDTRPKPGVKCPDCGYTNDPQAWYCGVCGADLN